MVIACIKQFKSFLGFLVGRALRLRPYVKVAGMSATLSSLWKLIRNPQVASIVKVRQSGGKPPLSVRLFSSDLCVYNQIMIDEEYRFEVRRQPKLIIDAGANIGLTSIYLANRYPEAKIYAIEPEDENFAMLEINTASYPQIVPIHKALWSEDVCMKVLTGYGGSWGVTVAPEGSDSGKELNKIEGIMLSTLMQTYGIEHIDLLKIDIEGAEKELFAAGAPWLAVTDALVIELHERQKPGCLRAFYNHSNGFDYEWRHAESIYLVREGACVLPIANAAKTG